MFFRVFFVSAFLFISSCLFGQTTDLLISEYGEGSSGNSKYIEIYNGTGATVNLANYRLCRISNGGAWCEATYNFTTANLADGTTLVVANNVGDTPGADEYNGGICSWNGDDAISLQKNTAGWNLLDVIGTDGADPGTGWAVAGTANATKDHRLTRKSTICSPNTDWDNSRGTTVANSEWILTSYISGSANSGHTTSCSTPCISDSEPTSASTNLNISNIACYSMDLSWSSGNGSNRIVVVSLSPISGTPTDQTNYNANASFGAGSTISTGEFVVYNGTGNSFTVNGLTTSTTYYFAIFEYNVTTTNCTENYFTTSLTANNTTTFCANSDPEITGILVDACGGSEGVNEFITFNNGSSSLDMDDLKVTFPFISPYCNTGCGGNTWVTNPTYTAQLNATAGCAGLFIEADPIPANAGVVIFTGSSPTYNFDFSGLCGTGPYYAVYANNTGTGGRFGNYNSDCTKYRTTTIEFGPVSDTVTYQPCMLSAGAADGDYVAFDTDGTPTYSNDGCTPTATLPIELLYFNGKSINTGNLLEWITTTEINNDYFTLEKSKDAFSFTEIGTIMGAGNSSSNIKYEFTDDNVVNKTNYYRLKQTDFDGKFTYSNTVVLSSNLINSIYYNNNSKQLEVIDIKNAIISIYNIQGQKIKSINTIGKTSISLNLAKGMYLISVQSENEVFSKKIIAR